MERYEIVVSPDKDGDYPPAAYRWALYHDALRIGAGFGASEREARDRAEVVREWTAQHAVWTDPECR